MVKKDQGRVRPIVEDWVGHWVLMEYMAGPQLDYDLPENTVEGPLVGRASTVYVERVGDWGVEARLSEERPRLAFCPGLRDYEDHGAFSRRARAEKIKDQSRQEEPILHK